VVLYKNVPKRMITISLSDYKVTQSKTLWSSSFPQGEGWSGAA